MKNIRVPAILGGALALLLSVPFAAAYSMAYSDWGAPHMIRLGIALDPLLSFHRSNEVVYRTYGQVFALVHPLLWLAARNWFRLHPPQTGRERRARALLLWGGGLAALGVVGDYFSFDTWLIRLFIFEWIGCLTLWAGCFIFGRALLENGQMPTTHARLFQFSFLVSLAATFALEHFPSGPTFGYALAWLVWGVRAKEGTPVDSPLKRVVAAPGFWLALISLALIALAAAWISDAQTEADRVAAVARADTGVTSNVEWEPFTARVEDVQMALVPAGCFTMGSAPEQLAFAQESCDKYFNIYGCRVSFEDETPAYEICIDQPFWIDVTEVTNDAYGGSYEGENWRDSRWPRETVTWAEAAAHCAGRGARLPTEAEWEYAARGPDSLIYPWGNEFIRENVLWFSLVLQPAGSFRGGASWVGALDMSGSAAEWVDGWYAPYPLDSDVTGDERVTRGGDWFAHASYELRSASRFARDPDFASTAVGFRCAADAP